MGGVGGQNMATQEEEEEAEEGEGGGLVFC